MCFVVYHSLSLLLCSSYFFVCFFFSSRRRHTRCALVTGVQTCALPIFTSSRPDWINERNKRSSRINYPSNACSPHVHSHPTRLYPFSTSPPTPRLASPPSPSSPQSLEPPPHPPPFGAVRSSYHSSALPSLMRSSYPLFFLTPLTLLTTTFLS